MTRRQGDAAVLVGRSLAVCAHPYAAWRRHRTLLAIGYFTIGFIITLGGLFLTSSQF